MLKVLQLLKAVADYPSPIRAFTPEWWGWLIATGVFMACAWGSKVNGILTVVAIGVAVLVDLWDLLDVRKNPSMVRTRLLDTHA
jgi:dolichyl-phosphate-mannose--protein O-mannosyl transferase